MGWIERLFNLRGVVVESAAKTQGVIVLVSVEAVVEIGRITLKEESRFCV